MVTYTIDATTGALGQSVAQDVGDAHTLTGEPQGRYVFAAFGPRGGPPYWDPSIVVYAPNPVSGRLTTLSNASSDPIWCRCCSPWGRSGEWYWLSASATRVYGMWRTGTYHDTYHAYVTHAVESAGQLGPAYVQQFDEWDNGRVTVDIDSDVLYKQANRGLTAHVVEPDGSLRQVGASDVCLDPDLGDAPQPLVVVGGFLFAHTSLGPYPYDHFVCSWEGPGLAPRAKLALNSEYAEYAVALSAVDASRASSSPAASRPPTLVAMRTHRYGAQYKVRLFAMSDGDLQALDTVEFEPRYPRYLLFHPSGRFLYVSHGLSSAARTGDSPDNLSVYWIDPGGRLEAFQTLEGAGGAMAVTMPAVAASAPGS